VYEFEDVTAVGEITRADTRRWFVNVQRYQERGFTRPCRATSQRLRRARSNAAGRGSDMYCGATPASRSLIRMALLLRNGAQGLALVCPRAGVFPGLRLAFCGRLGGSQFRHVGPVPRSPTATKRLNMLSLFFVPSSPSDRLGRSCHRHRRETILRSPCKWWAKTLMTPSVDGATEVAYPVVTASITTTSNSRSHRCSLSPGVA